MIKEVVKLIVSSNGCIKEGALFCDNITINAKITECISYLEEHEIIENSDYENKEGETINLELSLIRLNSIGYFQDSKALVLKNKYEQPDKLFYIAEFATFSDDKDAEFYSKYFSVIRLINAIKHVSKHSYTDVDIDSVIIFRDDQSLFMPLIYSSKQIRKISLVDINYINNIINTLEDTNSEKKLLFINELIDFLVPVTENLRFKFLLDNIEEYADKCNNAYQYYLRDFSYNKLKIELDSKALEFTQKIQSVINDSQTKLIAIPTAFILVFSAFDFSNLNSTKNILAIISLFIFAVIIQLFLNNQQSSLTFTAANIDSYKNTFKEKSIKEFILVDKELKKQKRRLLLVTIILWVIPISLLFIWAGI